MVSEINQHLTAKVSVKKIDVTFWKSFPKVGVDFEEILILDTIGGVNDTVIYSDLIRLKFNAKDLWNEKYVLQGAQVFSGVGKLKVYNDGRENYLLFKTTDTTTSTPIELKLEKIQVYDFRLSYENFITHQTYRTAIRNLQFKGDFKAQQFDLATKSELKILSIKNQGVSLLSNKNAKINIKLRIDKEKDLISLPKSEIEIEKLPFLVEGIISPNKLQFEINGKDLKLQDVTNHFLSDYDDVTKYQGKGIVTFHLSILDDLSKITPTWVDCTFQLKDGILKEPTQNLQLTKINVEGQYSNMKGAGKEFVHLKTFSFYSPTGPFNGQFLMSNFERPNYKGKANGNLNLPALKHLFRVQEVDSISGNVGMDIQFDVSTLEKGYHVNNLSGSIQLQNVAVRLRDYLQTLKNISGKITFNKHNALFEDISVLLNQSDLKINGEVENIEKYLAKQEVLKANIDVQSNYINVEDLTLTSVADSSSNTSKSTTKEFKLPQDIYANLMVNVQQLKYRDHAFHHLRSHLLVADRKLVFTNMNVENGGSSAQGSLVIEEVQPELFMVETDINSKGIDFKKLFKEWHNFDQNVIEDKNINGYAVVNLRLKAPFDWNKGIDKKQIKSTIGINIMDGQLKDVAMFSIIMKSLKESSAKLLISKKQLDLFEKRLMELKFDQLQNEFIINDGKVTIPDMVIQSSALDLNVGGWHTFDNQIEYKFSFRFRDLKTIQRETEFGIIEDDGTGFHIFMKMTGSFDNPKISWDKDAQKEHSRENRQKAKQEALSILKSEFGIGKGNDNIPEYQAKPKKETIIEVEYEGEDKHSVPVKEESELKKNIKKKVEKMKKEQEPEVEFEIE